MVLYPIPGNLVPGERILGYSMVMAQTSSFIEWPYLLIQSKFSEIICLGIPFLSAVRSVLFILPSRSRSKMIGSRSAKQSMLIDMNGLEGKYYPASYFTRFTFLDSHFGHTGMTPNPLNAFSQSRHL